MPIRVLKIGVPYAALCFAIEYFWPGKSVRESLVSMIVSAIFQAAIFALILAASGSTMLSKYEITVSEEEMSAKGSVIPRSVHRGKVRTLIERRRGLMISERGRVGTFLWGGMWIPREINEYELLKDLAVSWKE
jgi:hypothetical protein